MNNIHRTKLLALVVSTLLSCYGFSQQLATAEFEQGIAGKSVQVLDVRTADEFRQGHIAHSLQADWGNQVEFNKRAQHLDKTKPVYVYCASGGRSKPAADWFRSNGF